MATKINAYLNLNGKCREAMTFYKQCLGGELTLQTVAGSPMESQCPASMKPFILHSSLIKDELILMASDLVHGDHIHGNNMSLSVNCSSEKEIKTFFSNLEVGGKVIDPLKDQFWGAIFGALIDKYGIQWIFNFDKNQ